MSDGNFPSLRGDPAKQKIIEDEFGLEQIVKSVASLLQHRIAANGYAIGLEASWGAGKSTFINFLSEELNKEGLLHRVIRFEPWLVGTKESLLAGLFKLLIEAINDLGSDPLVAPKLGSKSTLLKRLTLSLQRYASILDDGNRVLDYAASLDTTGHTSVASLILKGVSWIMKLFTPKKSRSRN